MHVETAEHLQGVSQELLEKSEFQVFFHNTYQNQMLEYGPDWERMDDGSQVR